MYLTAAWLAWVFGKQRGVDALFVLMIAAIVLALGLWWFERQRFAEGAWTKVLAWGLLALALGTAVLALRLPTPERGVAAGSHGMRAVFRGTACRAARRRPAGLRRHDRGLVHHLQGQ